MKYENNHSEGTFQQQSNTKEGTDWQKLTKIKRMPIWAFEKLLGLSVQDTANEKKAMKEGLNSTGEGSKLNNNCWR